MTEKERHFIEVLTFVVLRHTYVYQTLDGLIPERFEQFEGEWNGLVNSNEGHSKFCKPFYNPCDYCIIEDVRNAVRLYEEHINKK